MRLTRLFSRFQRDQHTARAHAALGDGGMEAARRCRRSQRTAARTQPVVNISLLIAAMLGGAALLLASMQPTLQPLRDNPRVVVHNDG